MIFEEIGIPGAWMIEPEKKEDQRGFFARTWDSKEFAEKGLNPRLAQCNLSFNHHKGTLRGMHYQIAPYEEAKLIRCTRGAIYDVVIDLRRSSPTFGTWASVELSADNRLSLYIPEGLAHGYQTLEDHTETLYFVSEFYMPEAERGVRYDDPSFKIVWPFREPVVISDKDRGWPDFESGS